MTIILNDNVCLLSPFLTSGARYILVGLGLLRRSVIRLSDTLLRCAISHGYVLRIGRGKVFKRIGRVRLDGDISLVPVGWTDFAVF
jgi:hypothetical protein